jgi:type I restriction enzyme S subunit
MIALQARLPKKWHWLRMKYLARGPLQYGANEAALGDDPAHPRFIRITDLTDDGRLREKTFKSLSPELARGYMLSDGDLLLARSGATVGKAFMYRSEWGAASFAGYLIRLRPNPTIVLPQYLWYFAQSLIFDEQVKSSTIQATIQNVSADKYGNFLVPVPDCDEQRAIADFLDRETARIDKLVCSKRKLLHAMQEQAAATIERFVVGVCGPKGPSIHFPIPAGYGSYRLKYLLRSLEQGWSPQCDSSPAVEGEWGVLKAGCVNSAQFDPDENKALPPDLAPISSLEIRTGDVLMSRANTRELLGSAAFVEAVRPKLLLCDKLYRLRTRPEVLDPEFLVLFMGTSVCRYQLERDATGTSSSMQNIGQDTVRDLLVVVPPIAEQRDTVRKARKIRQQNQTLEQTVSRAISTLAEYRSTLISAAVTGQIDVRTYRPQEAAAACL